MTDPRTSRHALRVRELSQREPTPFSLEPEAADMRAIADDLALLDLRKLRFTGQIAPEGRTDWVLEGTLGATVVQPCVATLEPVTTRIDAPVTRRYLADFTEPDEPETEMPEDETEEALGTHIDPHAVMVEALSLALPLYPRAEDAEAVTVRVTEPGKTAMNDEDAKPFAGLAALKNQLETGPDTDED